MNTDLKPLKDALQRALSAAQLTEQSVNAEYEALPSYIDCGMPEQRELRRETRTAWLTLDDLVIDLQNALETLKDLEEGT